MMRATLFSNERKTFEVEETEDRILLQLHSAWEALHLIGVALAFRRFRKETAQEREEQEEGMEKDVTVKYGPFQWTF
ncbi:MAG: hypothetical protein SV186_04465 [Candidatus Nanohaloarchaea archaeon]|nr:hypothetical protein [Candidatus Nanohaloarchaea archaeon]